MLNLSCPEIELPEKIYSSVRWLCWPIIFRPDESFQKMFKTLCLNTCFDIWLKIFDHTSNDFRDFLEGVALQPTPIPQDSTKLWKSRCYYSVNHTASTSMLMIYFAIIFVHLIHLCRLHYLLFPCKHVRKYRKPLEHSNVFEFQWNTDQNSC